MIETSSAFRHVRVSQIEIMLCGHYNRKYGAALVRVRYLYAVRLFQKRIIIYYYYGYARNNKCNHWYTRFTLSRTRSSPDQSLNTYTLHYSSSYASVVVKFCSFSDKIMKIFFRDPTKIYRSNVRVLSRILYNNNILCKKSIAFSRII